MLFFRIFARVLKLGRSEWKLSGVFVFASLIVASAQLIEPMLFGRVIDALAKEGRFAQYLATWISLGIFNAVISILLSILSDRFAHRLRMHAMEMAFARTVSLPFRFHSLHGSGKVVRTIQTGSDQIFHISLSFYRENLIALWTVFVLIPLAFSQNLRLACVLFGLAVIYTIGNWFVLRHTHSRQTKVEAKYQELTGRLVDVMGNVTVVRGFTRVAQELGLFRALARDVLNAQYPVLTGWGLLNVLTRLSSMTAMVTVVAIGSSLVHSGAATQGEIVTFVAFATLLIGRLDQISSFLNRIVGQMPTVKNLFDLIDERCAEDIHCGEFQTIPVRGRVEFEGVSYRYGKSVGKSQGVLELNFTVEPGETIAIVGPTGSGKTTCLSLLQRLFSPDRGVIRIDGQDISEIAVEILCSQIATVFQEPGLFNRSIYDNILVGRPTAARTEVEEAARRAEAHDFILARPNGYDFVVGERGLALSGGERQRLAIARAILKNAPILVLDEATSALDNETERRVQSAMNYLSENKTTFVIAHRLSTVLSADRIFVMQGGRIVQRGTFAELRQQNGLFARLLQAGELGELPPIEEVRDRQIVSV